MSRAGYCGSCAALQSRNKQAHRAAMSMPTSNPHAHLPGSTGPPPRPAPPPQHPLSGRSCRGWTRGPCKPKISGTAGMHAHKASKKMRSRAGQAGLHGSKQCTQARSAAGTGGCAPTRAQRTSHCTATAAKPRRAAAPAASAPPRAAARGCPLAAASPALAAASPKPVEGTYWNTH